MVPNLKMISVGKERRHWLTIAPVTVYVEINKNLPRKRSRWWLHVILWCGHSHSLQINYSDTNFYCSLSYTNCKNATMLGGKKGVVEGIKDDPKQLKPLDPLGCHWARVPCGEPSLDSFASWRSLASTVGGPCLLGGHCSPLTTGKRCLSPRGGESGWRETLPRGPQGECVRSLGRDL